jgi:hypothetical protein
MAEWPAGHAARLGRDAGDDADVIEVEAALGEHDYGALGGSPISSPSARRASAHGAIVK